MASCRLEPSAVIRCFWGGGGASGRAFRYGRSNTPLPFFGFSAAHLESLARYVYVILSFGPELKRSPGRLVYSISFDICLAKYSNNMLGQNAWRPAALFDQSCAIGEPCLSPYGVLRTPDTFPRWPCFSVEPHAKGVPITYECKFPNSHHI